jgi:sialic acid synthase SpsE
MLSPQIAFVSKQIVFDDPIHEPKSIFPVMLASMLDRCDVKAYVVASLKFNEESEVHCRYERGLPIITATTMSAMSSRRSRMAQGRNGRMSSKKRMPVMMQ